MDTDEENLYGNGNEDEEELSENEPLEAYLSPESLANLRRLLGRDISEIHSLTSKWEDDEDFFDKLFLEISGNAGYVVLDTEHAETTGGYYHFLQLSADFAGQRQDMDSIVSEALGPHVQGPPESIPVQSAAPITKIDVYGTNYSDPDFPDSASLDKIIIFHHADGNWFGVSGELSRVNAGLQLVQDDALLSKILRGDGYGSPCERRLTLE
jgi:hypothetical protein